MKNIPMKYTSLLAGLLFCAMPIGQALAADPYNSDNCVESPSGLALDEEFGAGATDVTRCLANNNNANKTKLVFQINQLGSSKPYGMGNIVKVIEDYEVTHGMVAGEDYEIVAVVHSGAWRMMLDNAKITALQTGGVTFKASASNPFQSAVQAVLDAGVKIYFCQNTARAVKIGTHIGAGDEGHFPGDDDDYSGLNIKTGHMLDGIGFVTAGLSAIADFQIEGYVYIQP